jgi:Protein of unknown function (DUF2778)
MSHGTDALYGFAAQDPRRTSPEAVTLQSRAFTQNMLANVALAFVAATCAWTLWSHLSREEVATLAERFAALETAPTTVASIPAPAQTSVKAKDHSGFAALFDARHFRFTQGTLSGGARPQLAEHLAAPISPTELKSEDKAPPSPETETQVAQKMPLPAPRPVKLASVQPTAAPAAPTATALAPSTSKGVVEDKATVLALISNNKNSLFYKLFGKPKAETTTLAYAATDGGIASDTPTILFDGMPKYDQYTAVYDISARKVYMPDGTELEAHSGLGSRMDDPRNVHVKMHGSTPPHVYDLTMREALFHGTEAIRMTPVGGSGRIHGRAGILAHPYLLGPRGDSNGCVSFKDYDTFLQAFKKGQVKRMVVVERLA